jgi:hypothetical protein
MLAGNCRSRERSSATARENTGLDALCNPRSAFAPQKSLVIVAVSDLTLGDN